MVDDLGWQDTSVAFTESPTEFQSRYRTPHLARLAAAGMRFSDAYASGSVCTPTRTALLCGRSPARTRITDWTLHVDRDFSRRMPELADPPWRKAGLAPSPHLLPKLLRAQGYRTIFIGKAHFGARGTAGADPTRLGFDVNVAGHAAGAPGSYYGERAYGTRTGGPWGVPGLERYHDTDTFLTEALTLEMERELEEAAADSRPFFLDLSHYAVHTPIQADPRFAPAYRAAGLDAKEAAYASLIEGVDAGLGRLFAKLHELGIADDTLVVFTSDNGGLTAHGRGATPDGSGKDTHNRPLRSGKASGYEGGIRVPFVVGWAHAALGVEARAGAACHALPIEGGAIDDSPIITTDLFVTFASLANVPRARIEAAQPDGVDLSPRFAGRGDLAERALFWNYPHKWGPAGDRYEPFVAMRDGRWKLIYWYESKEFELFDLETDLGETQNVFRAGDPVSERARTTLRAWMVAVDAQRPIDAATGAMLPVP